MIGVFISIIALAVAVLVIIGIKKLRSLHVTWHGENDYVIVITKSDGYYIAYYNSTVIKEQNLAYLFGRLMSIIEKDMEDDKINDAAVL